MSGSAKGILAAAEGAGAPIRRIALTHAHKDHTGSLDALRERLPEVEAAIGARDARLLRGDMGLDPGEPQDKIRGGFVEIQPRLAVGHGRVLEPPLAAMDKAIAKAG
jgi:glyoxylase-like metal-dependent hydrolase (beta-lactamase superfamily II)